MGNIPSLNEIFLYQLELADRLIPILNSLWGFFWSWGWMALPFLLWPVFLFHWKFWRNNLWAERKNPQALLEIRIPEEISKPMRAMESVFAGFWQIYGPPNWHEEWIEGQFDLSFSLEIVSIEGNIHFLMRVPGKQKEMFKQHVYAQYPQVEIFEVEDYTQKVPQNIPNNRWDIWGTNYFMPKGDHFPLKTYKEFETEHEPTEEKVVEPMASLMEGLSQLEEGEQLWLQIKAKPVTADLSDFPTKSKKMYEKLAGRKEKPPEPPFWQKFLNLLTGYPPIKEGEKQENPWVEMMLTPGERDAVALIEKKRTKHLFDCFIRQVYIYKRESFSGSRIKFPMSYFNQFSSPALGLMTPYPKTITKVKKNWNDWFLPTESRLYLRKRKMFRNYVRRENAFFPLGRPEETFTLNTEELATLFHFPSRVAVPPSTIPRVESTKKEAPLNLPTEN